MKKAIFLIIVVAISSSCKKDYTCVCTSSGTTISTTVIHATKSTATSDCNAM